MAKRKWPRRVLEFEVVAGIGAEAKAVAIACAKLEDQRAEKERDDET